MTQLQPNPCQLTFYLSTDTRDESYRETIKNLGPKQKQVFEILQRGDRSNLEIANALGWPVNQVTGRVFELRELNLVFPGDKLRVGITNRIVQRWTVRK
jgi:DNA-directed RNA polymerase specialized sigma24 family protein